MPHYDCLGSESRSIVTASTIMGERSFQCWEKMWLSPKKGTLHDVEKSRVRRLFRTYWNLLYLLEETWRVLMKKMGRKQKNFYSEMWGNAVRVEVQGFVEILFVGLSICDEAVKYIWVNIWFMFDLILSQNCRNTLSLHTVNQQARSAKT